MKLVVVGAAGRMGRTLIRVIAETDGVTLAGAIERSDSEDLGTDAGVLAGLPRDTAETMVAQLLVGSSKLLAKEGGAATLRTRVTSPGGTTAAGLRVLEGRATRAAFIDAVQAASDRSRELGRS